MAETNELKYGSGNISMIMEGDDLVIRLDSKAQLHAKGSLNNDGEPRKRNLVATTGGFTGIGKIRVSVNATS